MSKRANYDVYTSLPTIGVMKTGELVIVDQDGITQRCAFRYTPEYLATQGSIALDPVALPLGDQNEFDFDCSGGRPALLDDYLPDDWGRKVLTQLALFRDKRRLSFRSVIDTLDMLEGSVIGALSIVPKGEEPSFTLGASIDRLRDAESAAQHVDAIDQNTANIDHFSLLHLANHGSGVGGARPKALIYDRDHPFLAKFNRISGADRDLYNNARVELACLSMAKEAGIDCFGGRVEPGINGREVLLLERFDVNEDASRNHLITINGLLKIQRNQSDLGEAFSYDHIYRVLQKHSVAIEHDLKQLLLRMLFNRSINNVDDHERNFSLINRGQGYRLSPAYDMVPSLTTGAYHAAAFGYRPYPPTPAEAVKEKKIFGLNRAEIRDCAEQVRHALADWSMHAEHAGVSEQETDLVAKAFHNQ
ncbi:type II toxin-antitoxin system HipA family toxin [Parahaliea mediterranea]|uniref:Type II toxin-antitoxin system HipA family toxin n=1 Tax=Parahaliea mediterranea TaxID=651086 RepID=A0A939DGL6_9GAMM|nr:type II toxin-antitoxin system HipA family toxin [Parahaliea mediterranea]MBN7797152.1 type II toxin-antitoxin system HipA family toxin [Parahaliea mediterranea]